MKGPVTPAEAELAKRELASRFSNAPWLRGIGIVPRKGGGLAVRVSIAPDSGSASQEVPEACLGVPVERLVIEGYKPRPAKRDATQRST